MVIDEVPCDKCKEQFKQGITFFEVCEYKGIKRRTGRAATVKEHVLQHFIPRDSEIYEKVLQKRGISVNPEDFNNLFGNVLRE
jgi:hypothetical protein